MMQDNLIRRAVENDWSAAELAEAAARDGVSTSGLFMTAFDALRAARPFKPPTMPALIHFDALLRYRGSNGKLSDRRITVHAIHARRRPDRSIEIFSLAAYCHEAKAPRTFLAGSILSIADPATGEAATDVTAWLMKRLDA